MAQAFNLTAQINLRGPSNIRQVVSDIRKQIGSVKADVKLNIDPKAISNTVRLNKSLQELTANLSNVSSAATSASSAIKSFGSSVAGVGASSTKLEAGLNKAATATKNLGTSSAKTSKAVAVARTEMEEFGRQSALAIRRFAAFSAVTGVFFSLNRAISSGLASFIDFDKELVRLQQVTGKSAEGLRDLQNEITRLSIGLGVSSDSLVRVSATLAQAGLSANETKVALEALAKSELAPSFDDLNKTVEGSIALIRQFGIASKDLEKALGSVNSVAAAFAVESGDIIAAIQRTGGVFAAASKGVSEGTDALNEFIAIFTSVRQTTRESAETIATGLRTIFTRIQRGETIQALKEFGVTLTDAEGKFVGAYKAIQLLSEGLNRLDPRDLRFSQIVEELGGFRQIGKVIPLIQQFAVAQEALKVAQAGQGSLANDAIKAQLSLANQITKVREEFLSLIRSLGQSDTFQTLAKGALTFASGLIKISSAVQGVLPALAILGAGAGLRGLTQFTSGFVGGLKKVRPEDGAGGGRPSIARSIGDNIGSSLVGAKTEQVSRDLDQNSTALDQVSDRLDSLVSSLNSFESNTSNLNTILTTNNNLLQQSINSLTNNTSSLDNLTNAINSLNLGGGTTVKNGGRILGFNKGGVVPGSGKGDKVPAMLEPGEVVISNKAADMYGRTNLDRMNKYASGGSVKEKIGKLPSERSILYGAIPGFTVEDRQGEVETQIDPIPIKLTSQDFAMMVEYIRDMYRTNKKQFTKFRDEKAIGSKGETPKYIYSNKSLSIDDNNEIIDPYVSLPKPDKSSSWAKGKAFEQLLDNKYGSITGRSTSSVDDNSTFEQIIEDQFAALDFEKGDAKFEKKAAVYTSRGINDAKRSILSKRFRDSQLSLPWTPNIDSFIGPKALKPTSVFYPENPEKTKSDFDAFYEQQYKNALKTSSQTIEAVRQSGLLANYKGGKIQKFMAGGQAEEVKDWGETASVKEILDLLGIRKAGEAGNIDPLQVRTVLKKRAPTPEQAMSIAAIRKEATKAFNRKKGASQAILTRLTNQGLSFAAAGMFGDPFEEQVYDAVGSKGERKVKIIAGVMDKTLAEELSAFWNQQIGDLSGQGAEIATVGRIVKEAKTGRELELDFDRTLAVGADDISSLKDFRDPAIVQEKLKAATLTRLGTALIDLVKEHPELAPNMRIVTARAQATVPLIQQWLADQGLSLSDSQFVGVGGNSEIVSERDIPALKAAQLRSGSLFIDDNEDNTKAASQKGVEAVRYGARLSSRLPNDTGAQGELFERMLDDLGAPRAQKGFGFDYPTGLKDAASFFNLPPDIPTDAKRTISGPSTIKDNITTYLKAMGFKDGGEAKKPKTTFGSGEFPFPKRISNAYFKEIDKILEAQKVEKIWESRPKNERMPIDEQTIQQEFEAPFNKEMFLASFKDAITRDTLYKRISQFARFIGLPEEDLSVALPTHIDFGGPSSVLGAAAQFDRTGIGTRRLEGVDLSPYGFSEGDKQDLFGYSKLIEEKEKEVKKVLKTPVRTFDDGSFHYDDIAARALWQEIDDLKTKRMTKSSLNNDAINKARTSIMETAAQTGRGAVSINKNLFGASKYEVLYHELTHQLINGLRTRQQDSFEKYKERVVSLFENDNDGLAEAFDALGGYNSADVVYGRSYKINAISNMLLSRSRQVLQGTQDPEQQEYFDQLSSSFAKANTQKTAKQFRPINPDVNKLLLQGQVSQAAIDRMEDSGKEEFLTTLLEKAPVLNENLSSILDSTLNDLLGSAGIKRQKFAVGGEAQAVATKLGKGRPLADSWWTGMFAGDEILFDWSNPIRATKTADGSTIEIPQNLRKILRERAQREWLAYVDKNQKPKQPLTDEERQGLRKYDISPEDALKIKEQAEAKRAKAYADRTSRINWDVEDSGRKRRRPEDYIRRARGYSLGGILQKFVDGGAAKAQTDEKPAKNFGKIGLRSSGSEISATYFKNGEREGFVTAKKAQNNLFTVGLSKATQGYGPRLYDVVMEAVTSQGGMLTSDRNQVSDAARAVWSFYFNRRSDVDKTPLDPSQWTKNQQYIDPKLYGKPETWPDATDPAWILQSGYSKNADLINSADVIDMNDPKYSDFIRQQQMSFMSKRNGGLISRFADGGSIPALVSNGEAYVPPKVAKKIGYDKLNKMNQADRNGMGRFSEGGISVFKGPGTGTSDSIPTNLPVGSFIIREKATKALGLSKGGSIGINRFAIGGPVDPNVAAKLSLTRGISVDDGSLQQLSDAAGDAGLSIRYFSEDLVRVRDIAIQSALKQGRTADEAAQAGKEAAATLANIDINTAGGEDQLAQLLKSANTVVNNFAENVKAGSARVDNNEIMNMAKNVRSEVASKVYASNKNVGAADPLVATRQQMAKASQSETGDILRSTLNNNALTAKDLQKALGSLNTRAETLKQQRASGDGSFGVSELIELKMIEKLGPQLGAKLQEVLSSAIDNVSSVPPVSGGGGGTGPRQLRSRQEAIDLQNEVDLREQQFNSQKTDLTQKKEAAASPIEAAVIQSEIDALAESFGTFKTEAETAQQRYLKGYDILIGEINTAAADEAEQQKIINDENQKLVMAVRDKVQAIGGNWDDLSIEQKASVVEKEKTTSAGDKLRAAEQTKADISARKETAQKILDNRYGDGGSAPTTRGALESAISDGSDKGMANASAQADKAKADAAARAADQIKHMGMLAQQSGMSLEKFKKDLSTQIGSAFIGLKSEVPKLISQLRVNMTQSRDKLMSTDPKEVENASQSLQEDLRRAVGSQEVSGIDNAKIQEWVNQFTDNIRTHSMTVEEAIASTTGLNDALSAASSEAQLQSRAVEAVAASSGVAKSQLDLLAAGAVKTAKALEASEKFNAQLKKLAIAIGTVGSTIQFALTEFGGSQNANTAVAGAVVGGATQTASAGLAAASQVNNPRLKGLILLGTAATTIAGTFKDANNALRDFNLEIGQKKLEESLNRTGDLFDKFSKDTTDVALLDNIDKELSVGSKQLISNLQTDLTVPKTFWANIFDSGPGAASRSMILEKEGIGSYIKSLDMFGGQDYAKGAVARLAPERALQTAQQAQPQGQNILRQFENRLRSGTSQEDILKELKTAGNESAQVLARMNPEINKQIMLIQSDNSLSKTKQDAIIQEIVATEASKIALTNLKNTAQQIEFEKLDREMNNFVVSLERMFNGMEQAIAKTDFGLNKLTRAADLSAAALSGNARAGDVSLDSINVLQNPMAYSEPQRDAAAEQASGFFGSQAGIVKPLLNLGEKLERTTLSTINRSIKDNPNANPEAIASNIKSSLDRELRGLGLPSNISDKIAEQTRNAFSKITARGEDTELSFDQIAEEVPAFSKAIGAAQRAQESAIKAMEFYQKNVNEYAQAMNQMVDYQIEANNRMRKATDIQARGSMDLAKAFGRSISLQETKRASEAPIKSMTGGLTDARDIGRNVSRLEQARAGQQAAADASANRGPAGKDEFKLMQNRLRNTNTALRENVEALKQMADSTELAQAALAKIQDVQAKRQAGANLIEKMVTSSPEELAKLNASMARLSNNMRGGLNTGSTAEQRGETLQTFNMLAPLLGNGRQQDELRANVLESMLKESGIGIDGSMQAVLDSLRDPEGDPQMAEAISLYQQGVNQQTEANRVLAEIQNTMSANTAEIAATKFAESISGVSLNFETQLFSEMKDGIWKLVEIAQNRKDEGKDPIPAQTKNKGGVIYASAGQMIDFTPKGTDTVPAMLTPGEFVVNRNATRANLPLLKSINSGKYSNGGQVQYLQTGGTVGISQDNKFFKPVSDTSGPSTDENRARTDKAKTQITDRISKEGLLRVPEPASSEDILNVYGVKRNFYAAPNSDGILKFDGGGIPAWSPNLGISYDSVDYEQNILWDAAKVAGGSAAAAAAVAARRASATKSAAKTAADGAGAFTNMPGAMGAQARKTAAAAAGKQASKAVASKVAKTALKSVAKRIPGANLLFAIGSLLQGDYQGAAIEALSGAASLIPGVGTALSFAIDAAAIAGGGILAGAVSDFVEERSIEPKITYTSTSSEPNSLTTNDPIGAMFSSAYLDKIIGSDGQPKPDQLEKVSQASIQEYKTKLEAFRRELEVRLQGSERISKVRINDGPPSSLKPKVSTKTKQSDIPNGTNQIDEIDGTLKDATAIAIEGLTASEEGYAGMIALKASENISDILAGTEPATGQKPFGLNVSGTVGRLLKNIGWGSGGLQLAAGDSVNYPSKWRSYTKNMQARKDASGVGLSLEDTKTYAERNKNLIAKIDSVLEDINNNNIEFEETEASSQNKTTVNELEELFNNRIYKLQLDKEKINIPEGAEGPLTFYNMPIDKWKANYKSYADQNSDKIGKTFAYNDADFLELFSLGSDGKRGESKKFPWEAANFKGTSSASSEAQQKAFQTTATKFFEITPGNIDDGKYAFTYSAVKGSYLDRTSRSLNNTSPQEYGIVASKGDPAKNPFATIESPIFFKGGIDSLITLLDRAIPQTDVDRADPENIQDYKINLDGSNFGVLKPLSSLESYDDFIKGEVYNSLNDTERASLVLANNGVPDIEPLEFTIPEYTAARKKRIADKKLSDAKTNAEKVSGDRFKKLKAGEGNFSNEARVKAAQRVRELAIPSVGQLPNITKIEDVGGVAGYINSGLKRLDNRSPQYRESNAWRALFSELWKSQNPEAAASYLKTFGIDLVNGTVNDRGILQIIAREKAKAISTTAEGSIPAQDLDKLNLEAEKTKLYSVGPDGKKTEMSPENIKNPQTIRDIEKIALTPENIFENNTKRASYLKVLKDYFNKNQLPDFATAIGELTTWYSAQDSRLNTSLTQDQLRANLGNFDNFPDPAKYEPYNTLLTGQQYGALPDVKKMKDLITVRIDELKNKPQEEADAPQRFARGGLVYASNGQFINFQPKGTDTVPAMLTPGEFVINRKSTQKYRPVLEAINSGNYSRGGVVNYLNQGGYLPIYRSEGGGASRAGSFDFTSFMNKLVGAISSSITTAFDKAVSNLKQPNSQASGVSTGSGDMASIDSFVNRLNNIANILSNIYIPPQITITGKHDVVVTINGDTVLNQLRPDLAGIVVSSIKAAFRDLKAKNPENTSINFDIDINPGNI